MENNKDTRKRTVEIIDIGELQIFRRENKPDFSKVMVDVKTSDGQKIYCEVRNSHIPTLNPLKIGDIVEIEYIFAGSEKNDKKYNNVFIVDIKKV